MDELINLVCFATHRHCSSKAQYNTFTTLSSPPETTHRPSGVNLMALTPRVCPLYVWMHPFLLISHILRFVSNDPEAKNSPNGWKSTDIQFDLWPVRVRTTAEDKLKSTYYYYQSILISTIQVIIICILHKQAKIFTLCLLQIPQLDRPTGCSGRYQYFRRIKTYWFDCTRVSR